MQSARRHPAFFPVMAMLLAAIVFHGFAPTYYLRPLEMGSLPAFLHLHGAAMTLWFGLLVVQTILVGRGRRKLHRRLGVGGVVLAGMIMVLTPPVVIRFIPRLLVSGEPMSTVAIIILGNLISLVVFGVLVTIAVRKRNDPNTHSRLMFLASIPILAPALGRASLAATGAPIAGLLVQMLLPFLLIGHDAVINRRVHPATKWGTAAVVGSQILNIGIANTALGIAAVRLLNEWL